MKRFAVKVRLWLVLPALAILLAALAGCTVARMEVPQTLMENSDELAVTGRQGFTWGKDLTFGDYKLTRIKRGWTTTTSWGIMFWSKSKATRKFQFDMKSPYRDGWTEVLAVTNARTQEFDFAGRDWEATLAFATEYLTVADFHMDDELWTVVLASNPDTGNIMEGVITNGKRQIKIEATRKLQGAAYDIADEVGYYFAENNEYIGAVENINAGAVFMQRTIDSKTRDLLAVGSGVVFIYTDILD